jgi:hypothetical protein
VPMYQARRIYTKLEITKDINITIIVSTKVTGLIAD